MRDFLTFQEESDFTPQQTGFENGRLVEKARDDAIRVEEAFEGYEPQAKVIIISTTIITSKVIPNVIMAGTMLSTPSALARLILMCPGGR